MAKQAEILVRGFARAGIIAVVDEATGYPYDCPRKQRAEILEKFISQKLALMKSSDDWEDFYRQLDRALPKYKPMSLFDKLEKAHGSLTDMEEPAGDDVNVIESVAVEV